MEQSQELPGQGKHPVAGNQQCARTLRKNCRAYEVDESSIKSPSQNRIASEARSVLGWLARELDCATLSEVARIVNRDVGSISSAVRRLSQRMQKVPELGERVRSLKADFS